jgi:NAD(P)-dependent dehydrogenase (short-subunit alcohol dehydrogenase family)
VRLDVTNPAQVAAAAERCSDVDLLINNAAVMRDASLLGPTDTDAARAEMKTNYFGTLSMCRAFAPVLGANGGAPPNAASFA